jgi:hypothetical protein
LTSHECDVLHAGQVYICDEHSAAVQMTGVFFPQKACTNPLALALRIIHVKPWYTFR